MWYECSYHWVMVSVVLLCFSNGANESDFEVVHVIQNLKLSFHQEKHIFLARDLQKL